MNLYKQGIFAQTTTQEEGSDVMSCFFHCIQNMACTKLIPRKKTEGESGYKKKKESFAHKGAKMSEARSGHLTRDKT